MARFYTNENVPLPVAENLRKMGHDVLTVAESGNAGIAFPDSDVLAFANKEQRILVTLNRRHFVKLHLNGADHSGIVVCSFDPDFEGQALAIHNKVKGTFNMSKELIRINRSSQPQ